MTGPTGSQQLVANAFMVASVEFAVGLILCYVVQLVRFFRRRKTAVAVLLLLCLILGGGGLVLGVPVAIGFGWMWSRQWGTGTFMALFSGLFVAVILNFVMAVVVRFGVPADVWVRWFG